LTRRMLAGEISLYFPNHRIWARQILIITISPSSYNNIIRRHFEDKTKTLFITSQLICFCTFHDFPTVPPDMPYRESPAIPHSFHFRFEVALPSHVTSLFFLILRLSLQNALFLLVNVFLFTFYECIWASCLVQ
jgi:hypothetical protein